jgi:outer membrane protein OmpA-like peptidoglycan-associated protein
MIRFYCFLIGFFGVLAVYGQDHNLSDGYYSVVASFSPHHEDYAQRMVSNLSKVGRSAKYGFDPNRKYWYVYTFQSNDKETCRAETLKLRTEPAFADAWSHSINKGNSSDEPTVVNASQETVKQEPAKEIKIVEEPKPAKVETVVIPNPAANPIYEPQNLNTTPVFLSLFNATTNEVQDGEVEIIDPENSKLISRVKGNEYLTLPNPKNKSGRLTLISNVFGYRKEELEVNYKNTEADTLKPYVLLVGDFYMINFALVRIHKGDISTLYNVYFFNDAAVMLPTSQYQLNSLLKMMKDSPTMKVTLHGHTNGGGRGKIIYMGPSKNFFAITKDARQGSGSAKELSEARAEVIREWLLAQGIEENRVVVKGWGGGRMIYDKDSQYARKNIRVDVEVTED